MDNKNEKKRTNRGLILVLAVLCMTVLCVAGSVLAKYAADVEAGKFQINIADNAPYSYTVQYMDGENELHVQQERDTKKSHVCTIIDTIPQKNGYAFLGWSANKNAETADYKAGDGITLKYGGDHVTTIKRTLYAVWKISMPILETGRKFNAHTPGETTAVIFTDCAAPEGATLTDVSEAKDGGIVAWMEDTTMYVSTQRSGVMVYANPDSYSMFSEKSDITSIDTTNMDVSKVTNMNYMFDGCTGLTALDVGGWDVSQVKSMGSMFFSCKALTTVGDLNSWNVASVTDMSFMFYSCKALTTVGDLSSWNVASVTGMNYMFSGCQALTTVGDLSSWNVASVKDMSFMFHSCKTLTTVGDLSSWNVASVTGMNYMFGGCQALITVGDLSDWDVSQVTNMTGMFYECVGLTALDVGGWDVSHVTNMNSMFSGCKALTTVGDLSSWNVASVTGMYAMFYYCRNLILDCSAWDVSKVASYTLFNDGASNVIAPTWVN